MYETLATVYDELISPDIDYGTIVKYITDVFEKYGKKPEIVCDLACGTGSVTVPMAQKGYEMIGVDISGDMLDIAREKAEKSGCDILFLNQDMKKLDLFGTCGAFLCMTDGFNYITSINALKKIFKRIRTCFIENDGIFIFDLSSEYKLRNVLGNNTYIYDTDEIFYAWENKYIVPLCRMNINFFVNRKGKYSRFEETHVQRAYSVGQIKKALLDSGFSEVHATSGYSAEPVSEKSERIVFTALA